jgi:hypothetical protein
MQSLVNQDLFDALAIRFREDSHIELLANALQNDTSLAQAFCRFHLGSDCPDSTPFRCETRVSIGNRVSKNIPDLVILFGKPGAETHAWVIEAKIEASEGKDQLARYTVNQSDLMDALDLPAGVDFLPPAFLTLDQRSASSESLCVDYSHFAESLDPERFSQAWMQLATAQLRRRLLDYYGQRKSAPDPAESLGSYLHRAKGLVTEKDLFWWLTAKVGSDLGYHTTDGVAQNAASASPLVTLFHSDWLSRSTRDGCPLGRNYSIHFETQLRLEDEPCVLLLLHYETNPYEASLGKNTDVIRDGLEAYWARRRAFVEGLSRKMVGDSTITGWKSITNQSKGLPVGNNRNQVTRRLDKFDSVGSIGEFRQWLSDATSGMAQAIDEMQEVLGSTDA